MHACKHTETGRVTVPEVKIGTVNAPMLTVYATETKGKGNRFRCQDRKNDIAPEGSNHVASKTRRVKLGRKNNGWKRSNELIKSKSRTKQQQIIFAKPARFF
jgi:hypothetical protein